MHGFYGEKAFVGGGTLLPNTRFMLSLFVMRSLTAVYSFRRYILSFLIVVPQIIPMLNVFLSIIYVFAAIGHYAFKDCYQELGTEARSEVNTLGNFDNLSESLYALFQMMVGEGWNNIADAHLDCMASMWTTFYFWAYMILVNMIGVNLLIAVIIELFVRVINVKTFGKRGKLPLHWYKRDILS